MTSLVFNSTCIFSNPKRGGVDGAYIQRRLRVRSSVASVPLVSQVAEKANLAKTVRIAVLGASGYTGAEDLPNMVAVQDADFSNVDAVFCCLPHGTTQKEAVYGLTELLRPEIQNAQLVANPGCYPTSIQLPLVPLLKGNLIKHSNIIIDAKSGVSGAGRSAKEANLYTEVAEGIHAYGITRHRHVPEIEQGLSDVGSSKVVVSFTPHLMPMSRGMQSTIYVEMSPGVKVEDLYKQLSIFYEKEEFVKLLPEGVVPHTRHVRGSNYCCINVFPDRIPGRAIIISVIDNLVKGASGQAVQNLNLMMGYPESTGLLHQPLFP
ncbi:hypothetical protein KSS87_021342 [Heliosperma pusillum]|nr:hypothetical protein KSS87_021342 [Heliosperma pusillum]